MSTMFRISSSSLSFLIMTKLIVLLAFAVHQIIASPLEGYDAVDDVSAAFQPNLTLEKDLKYRLAVVSDELKGLVSALQQSDDLSLLSEELAQETKLLNQAAEQLEEASELEIVVDEDYDGEYELVIDEDGNIPVEVEIIDNEIDEEEEEEAIQALDEEWNGISLYAAQDEEDDDNQEVADAPITPANVTTGVQPGTGAATTHNRIIGEKKKKKKLAKSKKGKKKLSAKKKTGKKSSTNTRIKNQKKKIAKKTKTKTKSGKRKKVTASLPEKELAKLCQARRKSIIANQVRGSVTPDGKDRRPALITTLTQLTQAFERLQQTFTKQPGGGTSNRIETGSGLRGSNQWIGSGHSSSVITLTPAPPPQPAATGSGQPQPQPSNPLDPLVKAALSVQGSAAEALKRILPAAGPEKANTAAASSSSATAQNAAASKSSF